MELSALVALPGLVEVAPIGGGRSVVRIGPSAGWMVARGIGRWEKELSFVRAGDLTAATARALRATLPIEQIAPKRYPRASHAAATAPFLPIAGALVADARKQGLRVHTVGVDRVSAGFYYFAEGGLGAPVHLQGNLVEMLGPSLTASSTNAEIATLLDLLIDRLLFDLSGGTVSELDVELADALPRLSRDATGVANIDLDGFESTAHALAQASAPWERAAARMVELLRSAEGSAPAVARIPLFAEARREVVPALEVQAGDRRWTLPERSRWTVAGSPRADLPIEDAAGPMRARAASQPTPTPSNAATAPMRPRVQSQPSANASDVAAAPMRPRAQSQPSANAPDVAAAPMRPRAQSQPSANASDATRGAESANALPFTPTPAMAFGIAPPATAPRPSGGGRSRTQAQGKGAVRVLTPPGPWTADDVPAVRGANDAPAPSPAAGTSAANSPQPLGVSADSAAEHTPHVAPARDESASRVEAPWGGETASTAAGETATASPGRGGEAIEMPATGGAETEMPAARGGASADAPPQGGQENAERRHAGAEAAAEAASSSGATPERADESTAVARAEAADRPEGRGRPNESTSATPAAALVPAGVQSPWKSVAAFAILVAVAIAFLAARSCGHAGLP